MVRDDDHRLAREAHAPLFERERDAGERLAGADDVMRERVRLLQAAPDEVLLMRPERDAGGHARQRQMGAVGLPQRASCSSCRCRSREPLAAARRSRSTP
jgi:hypothetical protein